MRAALSRLDPWAPPLALMALVWALSAQPDLDSGLGLADLIGRKLVHVATYALLCLLWWRALRLKLPPRAAIVLAAGLAIAYGAVDELHQTTVAGRNGSPLDVAIDSAGALLAAGALARRTAAPAAPRAPA